MLLRTRRETLLRPLEIISGIVNRRHHLPDLAKILGYDWASMRRRDSPVRKAKTTGTSSGTAASGAGEPASPSGAPSGGDGNGSDGGDGGDGEGDGPRRRSHSRSTSSSSRAVQRNPPPRSPVDRAHALALLTLVLLAVLAFAMALLLTERGHLWLASEVIAALGGLPVLARALVKPK
jgi:hypothetical protein